MDEGSSIQANDKTSSSYYQEWIEEQESLKRKLVLEDDFTWAVSSRDSSLEQGLTAEKLKYIGGVDISFLKEDPSVACGAVVVLDADTLDVIHEEFDIVRLQVPYVPGFLAFREAPILAGILDKMKLKAHPSYPQLLMVDGNGILHPRGFGLACHLGVLANIPTIGIGKNLHHVDGLTQSAVKQCLEANSHKELIPLIGNSGKTWGLATQSGSDSSKPIYISVGHRISLDTAKRVVKACCKYRVPEPVRQADIRSKVFLQKFKGMRRFTPLLVLIILVAAPVFLSASRVIVPDVAATLHSPFALAPQNVEAAASGHRLQDYLMALEDYDYMSPVPAIFPGDAAPIPHA